MENLYYDLSKAKNEKYLSASFFCCVTNFSNFSIYFGFRFYFKAILDLETYFFFLSRYPNDSTLYNRQILKKSFRVLHFTLVKITLRAVSS